MARTKNVAGNMNIIDWTPTKLARLKIAHHKAVRYNKSVFVFDDHEYTPAYTKYLIDYLDEVFNLKVKI